MRKLVIVPVFGEIGGRELTNLVRNAIIGVVDSIDFSRDHDPRLHCQPHLVIMARIDMSTEEIGKALDTIEGIPWWAVQVYNLEQRLFEGQDSETSMR